ncbi:MAG: nucleotidyl transferase AbiEii/AbiGii toxin family protein [Bacteroidetes bacterium]|nr:nucleotidyl transferase AbiEii/AbiGii toxin family protein [Bacteroidota bacterium]
MNNFLKLSDTQKRDIIGQVAIRIGIPAQAVEKDLWVTAVLQMVFSLPFADRLVFKGGTSLSKVWRVINRFSEDIDLAIDRELFEMSGNLTIKQIKTLRKNSSLFVKTEFCNALREKISSLGLPAFCTAESEPDGDGDKTYPEPRKISVKYKTLFDDIPYLLPEVTLEVGARSLFEPTAKHKVKSLLSETVPINTDVADVEIITSVPEKTFLEKAFLLHEIFTAGGSMEANRKSRHLYDLERMMDEDFAVAAVANHELWDAIHHHRELFTRVSGVDYSTDIRSHISIIPPQEVLIQWKEDYMEMQNSMIYGDSVSFDSLLKRLKRLEDRFRENPKS